MVNQQNIGAAFSTFSNLTKELELFADVSELRLAFDRKGQMYLIGRGFEAPLSARIGNNNEIREELRKLIAQHCPRVMPLDVSQPPTQQGFL